ncbi:MAG: hypothetical protein ACI9J3_000745 [Parvicellaceae bacterium]|jgi:hypothetical protein
MRMTNFSTLFTLLLLIPATLFAQVKLSDEFSISLGTPYNVVDARSKEYRSVGDNHVVSVKTAGAKVTVQLFNLNENKEISRTDYEDFPKYSKVQEVIQLAGKLFYIFEAYNKPDKTFSVYSREVNTSTGKFNDAQKLFTTKMVVVNTKSVIGMYAGGGFGAQGMYVPKKFEVFTSSDQSKLLIRFRNKPLSKSDAINFDILGFYVFDSSMKKIWGHEVKMPHTEKQMNNLAYSVTKDGVACMLAYLNESKSFELITVDESGTLKQNKLDINGELIFQKFYMIEDPDGNMNCAGYYANGYDFKVNWTGSSSISFNTNGIYQFKTDLKGDIVETHDFDFSKEFIDLNASERQRKNNAKREAGGKGGMPDLKMLEFFQQADGSVIFVGEQSWNKEEMWMMSKTQVFHYAHVVVTKINKDGEMVWQRKIAKDQAGVAGKGSMSIKYMNSENAHYIVFLDNEKNAHINFKTPPEKHKDGLGGILTAVKIDDETGVPERHSVLDPKDLDGKQLHQFNPSRIFHVSGNVFALEAYLKEKKDGMVKMTIK